MSAGVQFDSSKAYAQQEQVYFDDGREAQLLRYILSRSDLDELKSSPSKVLGAIDQFGRQQKYLMNVGEDKGLELGGYVGYSAILFGEAARSSGGEQYLCLESNPEFASIATTLIDLAGLGSFVKIMVGPSSDSLRKLHSTAMLSHIDFLFLDHYKPSYLPDLKLCEQLGLIGDGAVIVADNVIKPGNPPYLEYVRSSVEEKQRASSSRNATAIAPDSDATILGNPSLVYESELVHSFEPTGIPVSPRLKTALKMLTIL
ncbi:catechol O-methyltransferase [Cordyceps javanica]|uniref:catechol O-methyltransferase n=1 Tax=Cordyceps javanica TaxID=43265 RepID=A0A545UQ55_9HYPO|nr:catechol O-methyltransferase [Cordyceps javanica]